MLIKKQGSPKGRVEFTNKKGEKVSVLVDEKGKILEEEPKWLNEAKRNPYANRKSFIVPELPWHKGGKRSAKT